MIKYKKTRITTENKSTVVCDICKQEWSFKDDKLETQEFHHIRFTGGYESVFGDGLVVECDICQHCLYRMIGKHCKKSEVVEI